jgi:hypothetical protein
VENIALVAMRLADMVRVHPHQDNSKKCSDCGHQVGIYPSGQNALRHNKTMKILCSRCAMERREPGERALPAASWSEMMQEKRDSKPVSKA